MKIRKTKATDRNVYVYKTQKRVSSKELVESKVVIRAGEDGVTEEHIKLLHSLDDSEVYFHTKNLHPNRDKAEKKAIADWRKRYIKDFKNEYGYEPTAYDVDDLEKEVFPANWNLSLDCVPEDIAKTNFTHVISDIDKDDFLSDRIDSALNTLTEKQRAIFNLVEIEGYKIKEVAEMFGTSSANIRQQLDKAIHTFKKNYK